jgi:C-terminal processing protease CtpA/Prc
MPSHRLNAVSTMAALAAITLLAGACGGGGGGGGNGSSSGGGTGGTSCSETARKQFVLDTTREWYLFPELLPSSVTLSDYATAEDLLDALTATARDQGKDRYFSYLTTKAADNTMLGEGQFNGFGFRVRTESGNRPFILEVFESSPASEAGMLRGDEIVAVDQGSGFVPVSDLLADGSTITDALGPADVGIRRSLRLVHDGVTRDVAMTKRTVTIDPVPDSYGVKVFPLAGTTGVGYVALRSYVSTADTQLRNAFAQFRAQGLQDYIVDLRYNGGGLVAISELINNLFGGARSNSDVQFRTVYSSAKSSRNSTTTFNAGAQSVQPVRIAFLTTEATASSSEININSLRPWVEVAIVGGDTFGKPVGQLAFDLGGCDDRLRLIAFKTVNKLDQGDYYDGLASSMRFACAATDSTDKPLGDPTEGLSAAALDWLKTGTCASVISAVPGVSAKPGGGPLDRYPLPKHPSAAQRWLPGIN